MEANRKNTTTGGTLVNEGGHEVSDGWISPDVLAAMNGEKVEFGHDLTTPNTTDNIDN